MVRQYIQKGIIFLPFLMLLALVFIMQRPNWMAHSKVSIAVSIDLIMTIPLVWYFIIRKRSIPNTTVFPVMFLCVATGLYLLPEEHSYYLQVFKSFAAPVIELGLMSLIAYKVVQLRKKLKQESSDQLDFYDTLRISTQSVFPKKVANIFTTEIATFYFAFRLPKKRILASHEFSYHKDSGISALYGAIVFIILVETVVLHILLSRWSEPFAWVLSGLSVYTCLQFLAYARSFSARPILVKEQDVYLRFGIVSSCAVKVDNIEHVTLSSSDLPEGKGILKLGLLGPLESHNTILYLKEEVEVVGLYGLKKKAKVLALFLDEPQNFKTALNL